MHNQKNKIIIVMIVAVLFMATGYAFFSTYLNINATGNITTSWNVYFSKIEKGSVVGRAKDKTTPKLTATTATIDVDLALPGDSITYNITLTNGGSVDAIIADINATGEGTDAIIYTISGLKIGDKLAGGTNKVISIKIEYDNNITSQPTSTSKRVTLTIEAVQDIGQNITVKDPAIVYKLSDKILSSNTAYATNVASPYVTASTGIDFSKPSSDTNGKGLYMANDDDGVSYFFRGDVDNNYVQFGGVVEKVIQTKYFVYTYLEGYKTLGYGRFDTESACERSDEYRDSYYDAYCYFVEDEGKYAVVFVGGVSEYRGDTAYDSWDDCETSSEYGESIYDDIGEPYYEKWCDTAEVEVERIVPPTMWRIVRINGDGSIRLVSAGDVDSLWFYEIENDEALGTYWYSVTGFRDYAYISDGDIIDSHVKEAVDYWYRQRLGNSYLPYLEDTTYCSDREVDYYYVDGRKVTTKPTDESSIEEVYFKGHSRLYGSSVTPKLTCNQNDRFTVSSDKGNGLLTYPIGLLTADEIVYSGYVYSGSADLFAEYLGITTHNYLNVDNEISSYYSFYSTMTPASSYYWDDHPSNACVFVGEFRGTLTSGVGAGSLGENTVIRPVINLKADTEVTGSGTKTDPYVVKIN